MRRGLAQDFKDSIDRQRKIHQPLNCMGSIHHLSEEFSINGYDGGLDCFARTKSHPSSAVIS